MENRSQSNGNQKQSQNGSRTRMSQNGSSVSPRESGSSREIDEASSRSLTRSTDESKSLSEVISKAVPEETQEAFEMVLRKFNVKIKKGGDYIGSNPREAVLIAVSAGLAGWALLSTKPGRKIFDSGATILMPKISDWFSENFTGKSEGRS